LSEAELRFDELYARYVSAVLAYALRRADPATAEDVTAEVFTVAWRRLDDLPADSALPWLYATARRVLANERRARRRRSAVAARAATEQPVSAASTDDDRGAEPILAALDALPEREREVLMLAAWEELSSREAARVLGCTPTAYRIRLHHARRHLRARLAENEAETAVSPPQVHLRSTKELS
jgi:RNA polymerase sigma-70 factor (ECF subfamily)